VHRFIRSYYRICSFGRSTDEFILLHTGLTGAYWSVLGSLWTTAPALIVDFVGLTGALFYRAAGSVSSVKPAYSSLCTSDQPVIYTVLNLAPFFAFASAIVFAVP